MTDDLNKTHEQEEDDGEVRQVTPADWNQWLRNFYLSKKERRLLRAHITDLEARLTEAADTTSDGKTKVAVWMAGIGGIVLGVFLGFLF